MKFGVSLICYNEEKNLPECIQLIIKQTLKPNYIVIIDDMSTDKNAVFPSDGKLMDCILALSILTRSDIGMPYHGLIKPPIF